MFANFLAYLRLSFWIVSLFSWIMHEAGVEKHSSFIIKFLFLGVDHLPRSHKCQLIISIERDSTYL